MRRAFCFSRKLQAVADDLLLAVFAMLPGDEVALFDGALLAVAALAFQKKFHALAPALPANRANVSCQVYSPYLSYFRCGLQPLAAFVPLTQTKTFDARDAENTE